jgi:hypothetical protein
MDRKNMHTGLDDGLPNSLLVGPRSRAAGRPMPETDPDQIVRPLRLSDINATTEPNARAAALCIEAQKLGLDAPTEGMIGDAINTAISEVLMWVGGPWHERYYDIRLCEKADRGPEGD